MFATRWLNSHNLVFHVHWPAISDWFKLIPLRMRGDLTDVDLSLPFFWFFFFIGANWTLHSFLSTSKLWVVASIMDSGLSTFDGVPLEESLPWPLMKILRMRNPLVAFSFEPDLPIEVYFVPDLPLDFGRFPADFKTTY